MNDDGVGDVNKILKGPNLDWIIWLLVSFLSEHVLNFETLSYLNYSNENGLSDTKLERIKAFLL